MVKKELKGDEAKLKKKHMLTFILIMLPSLLLAMSSSIINIFTRFGFQIIILIWQFVMIKNLLDEYYLINN